MEVWIIIIIVIIIIIIIISIIIIIMSLWWDLYKQCEGIDTFSIQIYYLLSTKLKCNF